MKRRALWILGGALLTYAASPTSASDLKIGRLQATAGAPVTVPVTYTAKGAPAATALSTEIRFDKGLANPRCAAGDAIAGGKADKTVRCGTPEPNVLRIIVFGFNQDPIPSGEIATITFDVLRSGRHRIHRLGNLPLASDGTGREFRLARKSGIVRVGTP